MCYLVKIHHIAENDSFDALMLYNITKIKYDKSIAKKQSFREEENAVSREKE